MIRHRTAASLWLASAAMVAAALPATAQQSDPTWGTRTTLATVSPHGRPANAASYDNPALSRHGRYVAFSSDATNLVGRDTNRAVDIFVRDRRTKTTRRVSVGGSGRQGNGDSIWPSMSANGRFVAFTSTATNLVRGDTNGVSDVFVRDRWERRTVRISRSWSGSQSSEPSYDVVLSADGHHAVFVSEAQDLVRDDTNGVTDVFVRNLQTGTTTRVSEGNDGEQADARSFGRAISPGGRYVAFVSGATNLVADDTNEEYDVFLRDLSEQRTVRVSVGPDGRQADAGDPMGTGMPQAVSNGGRYVLFDHDATTLVDGDTNFRYDVFLRDVTAGTTRRLSVAPDGSELAQDSFARGMDGDARKVLFSTYNELVAGDTNFALDVFVLGLRTGRPRLVSVATNGRPGNDDSGPAAISADGRHVAFLSHSSNLVPVDRNRESDMFVRDLR